ncbi:hypothetical protein FPRO04_08827 [Fusarium proliferatum]|nr:hypothetical protein FPRO04_08827 [Fusarium proliferatum]
MRSALLFGLVGSAKASGDYFEPFPTCADCLPASVHDAPGIGFSLSLSSGTAAVHFYNGTVKNIALIPANLEYAALVAASLPHLKVILPLPAASGYLSQLLESYAVLAGHGKGLCAHYKNLWQCEEEQDNVPLETTLVVGITPTDLRGEIIRTWSAFTDLQPRRADPAFVDLDLGLSTAEDKPDFWARVTERLQGFCGTVTKGFRLDTILLTGENATHPAFLQALRSALVGNGYLQTESDSAGEITFAHEEGMVIDPVFASARGAAQYARWRQEAPLGCEEQDSNVLVSIEKLSNVDILVDKAKQENINP